MATRSEILDLSDDDKATVFYMLDIALNRTILFAFLQGESLSFVRPYACSSCITPRDIHRNGCLYFVEDLSVYSSIVQQEPKRSLLL